MSAISIKQLLEAGVHFGHQTHRWNPKMKEYIYGERNGIYIIDLQKTLAAFKDAVNYVADSALRGKTFLFVGTKPQAQESIREEAERCRMFYVNHRWLGGLLTNFATIQISIKRYKELDEMRANGFYEKLSKKEAARLERERKKLEKNLRGIRDMERLPDAVFVVDSNHEAIAVSEACKLGIPVIGIVDTNSDPDVIDYVIPGNDDALRAVRLFASTIADAIIAGAEVYRERAEAARKDAAEKAAREAAARRAAKEAKEAGRRAQEEAAQAKQAREAKEAKQAKEAKDASESAAGKGAAKSPKRKEAKGKDAPKDSPKTAAPKAEAETRGDGKPGKAAAGTDAEQPAPPKAEAAPASKTDQKAAAGESGDPKAAEGQAEPAASSSAESDESQAEGDADKKS